jgi:hypothetical protein
MFRKFIILFLIFSQSTVVFSQSGLECSRKVNFGDISICLPKIEGLNECYNLEIVKDKADKNDVEQVEILGFYLNDYVFSQVDRINDFEFDDYVKIYSLDLAKGINFKSTDLNQMTSIITGNAKLTGWDKIIKELNNQNSSFTFNEPTYVEQYTLNEKSRTSIFIIGIQQENKQSYIMGSINTIVIRNRVVFLSYYLKYEDPSTLQILKKKNNDVLLKFQKANT